MRALPEEQHSDVNLKGTVMAMMAVYQPRRQWKYKSKAVS